jgi:hypothetical protein
MSGRRHSGGAVIPQHRSVLFERYDEPMLRWADAGIGQGDDAFDALIAWVETTSGVLNTQHRRFALSRSEREGNMEVVCGWGDYIHQSDCFHEHLNAGFRVGFVGTSDGHRRTPGLGGGLTGLWVRDFTLPGDHRRDARASLLRDRRSAYRPEVLAQRRLHG